MKIGIVSRGVPSEKSNIGIFEYDQAKALKCIGMDVVFFVLDLRSIKRKRKWGISKYSLDGFDVYEMSIPVGPIYYKIFNYIGAKCFGYLYNKYLKNNEGVDILHAHFSEIGAMVHPYAKKNNITYVFTEHSSMVNKDVLKKATSFILKRAVSNTNTIAVSNCLKEKIYKHTNVNSIVIPNIIDTELFKCKQKVESHCVHTFLTTARLDENKRIDLLLKSFANIVKDFNSNVILIVCGTGPQFDSLVDLCKVLNIDDKVVFKGFCEREEISNIYESVDCFVLPSYSETFGVSYLEAISSGVPVIATRCGGPEDFINEKNGILVEKDDVDSLTAAMRYMIDNSYEFDSIKLHEYVKDNYSGEVIAKKLKRYFVNLIGEGK